MSEDEFDIREFRNSIDLGEDALDDFEKERKAGKEHIKALEKILEKLDKKRWGYDLNEIREIAKEALDDYS